jgi:hypothetical protein
LCPASKKKTQLTLLKTHSFVSNTSLHPFVMAKGRRKLQAVLSDDEAPTPPTPQRQQLEVTDANYDADSDVDGPLPSSKKPRLEETTTNGK